MLKWDILQQWLLKSTCGKHCVIMLWFSFFPVFLPVYNQSNNQLTIRLTACDPLMIKITIAEEFVSVCVRQRRKRRRIPAPRRRDCIREPRRLGSQSIECERRISAALFTFWSLKRFLLEKPPQRQDSASLIRGATVSTAQCGNAPTQGNVCTQTKHKISGLIRSESSVCRGTVHTVEGESMTPAIVRFQLKHSHILLNFHISLRSREEVK